MLEFCKKNKGVTKAIKFLIRLDKMRDYLGWDRQLSTNKGDCVRSTYSRKS